MVRSSESCDIGHLRRNSGPLVFYGVEQVIDAVEESDKCHEEGLNIDAWNSIDLDEKQRHDDEYE